MRLPLVQRVAAMLDLDPARHRDGEPLPRGWHVCLFNVPTRQSELRPDGAGHLGVTLPDVDVAPVAAAFGFQAATVRTLDELRALAPLLAQPDGPILLDCKINASVAAPFMDEAASARRH